jgi:hypothetical protein
MQMKPAELVATPALDAMAKRMKREAEQRDAIVAASEKLRRES